MERSPTGAPMATSASQPYIARLGFQDPDRSKDRHGLACEYLFERLLHVAAGPFITNEERDRLSGLVNAYTKNHWLDAEDKAFAANEAPQRLASLTDQYGIDQALKRFTPVNSINVPISNRSGFTSGFADVLIRLNEYQCILGEVKITRQPAEQVMQQVNFYNDQLRHAQQRSVIGTYILTDYDCSDLQRLTQGSDVKVFRLGRRFEQWLVMRSTPATPEL